jgi:hypothetical protein
VHGREDMTPSPSDEALSQLRLRYEVAAAAADRYHAAGFTVVLEDVVAGPMLEETVQLIKSRPLNVIVLLPSTAEIAARDAGRGHTGYRNYSVDQFRGAFARDTPRVGLWLDTSDQSPAETVDEILRRAAAEAAGP